MAKLTFTHSEETVEIEDGGPIAEVCEEAGVPFACTEGVCGTCVVEVISGKENLSKPTQEEEDFLGEGTEDERLACQCNVLRGKVVLSF